MFAALQDVLMLLRAICALEFENHLLRHLDLFAENGLRLATITGLFPIITTLSLCPC